jgi:OmpA-OmpF porin, OOP family
LQDYTTLTIKGGLPTNGIESDKYDVWFSEYRAARTAEYMESGGIFDDRIDSKGFGEEQLTNDYGDNVPCPESKHRKNRRSEFLAIIFYRNGVWFTYY